VEIIGAPNTLKSEVKKRARSIFQNESAALVIILVAMVAVFAVLSKGFVVTKDNVLNVLVQSSVRGVAAIGQSFVILTGGIDLSVGGVALVSIALGASYLTGQVGLAAAAGGVAIVLFLAMGIGSTSGLAVSRLSMPPLMVTLALAEIARGISLHISGGRTITDLPAPISVLGQSFIGGVPVAVIFFISLAVVAHFVLRHTAFGRYIYAVGGNMVSAWLSGIRVNNVLFWAYALCGLYAGMAGLLTMSRIMCFSMTCVPNLELDSISAAVIGGVSLAGGRGNILGVVIGSLIVGFLNNGMNVLAVSPAFQEIAKGSIIYGAVAADYIRRKRSNPIS
jgi:ribose/xylose/arabinose/galactoside ABC-type transport system permease subunit